jgi:hypothetical protein
VQKNRVIHSAQVSVYHESNQNKKCKYYSMNVFIRMTYINSSKPEAKHTDVEAKYLDFVTLD